MHHLIMVNFSRRQLHYSAAERLMGAGTKTDGEISVPKTIGVPMSPGMKLGSTWPGTTTPARTRRRLSSS